MHNNYHFLRKLAEELHALVAGTELLVCFTQDKDEAILGFSNNYYLKCILRPEFSAITVVEDFSRARKNSVSLWENTYGSKVLSISTFENERAVKIQLSNDFTFVIKLFGNRPNLLIYKGKELLSMFNNKLLTDRSLTLDSFDRPINVDFVEFENANGDFRKLYFTLGKDLASHLDSTTTSKSLNERWAIVEDFVNYLKNPAFYIDSSGLLPKLSLLGGDTQINAINAINNFVSGFQRVSATDHLKATLNHRIQKDISKTRSYISSTAIKLDALKNGVKNEELGNILMANLHAVKDGETEVELLNFYTDTPIKIKLKKELSPQKNAESYYRKSKNEKIEIETAENNILAAEQKLVNLQEQLIEIEESDGLKTLRGFSKNLVSGEKEAQKAELPFKEYFYKNIKIWVGRNAKNNDLLLTKYTQKDDWWLHARDTPGSHVVVKNPNPSMDVLEHAASIAAYYSKRKGEKLVTVIYTQKKYVRKAKNLAAGQVIVEKEKTLLVEPIDGLKGSL